MPEFVSVGGEWRPAREKKALKNTAEVSFLQCRKCGYLTQEDEESKKCVKCDNTLENANKILPGEDFIYEGEDRAALAVLMEKRVKSLGQKAVLSPELKEISRKMGFDTVEEYVKAQGVDVKEEETKNEAILKTKVISDRKEKKSKARNEVDNTDFLNGKSPIPNGGFGNTPTT